MASPSTAPRLSFVQERLREIRNFPCPSSTHAALNLPVLQTALQAIKESAVPLPVPPRAPVVSLVEGLSPSAVTQAVGMSVISYLAMHALATLSLYVNGAVGMGKIALSLACVVIDYKAAQNLLEEGAFHVLVATADFAIAYFTLARAALAIAYGVVPGKTKELFEMFYKPWSGAIQHVEGATDEAIHADRKNYSYLQATADAIQCFIMPDDGVSRFQAAYAALQGKPAA